jgi:phosphoesterase RecJ-like protein
VLDHHASNDRFGSINVVDVEAAATAVVVRELARRLGWELNRDAALCLYTGLVTDTGRFQYDNTTPEVFELATELSRFDLPIADITRQLFEEHSFRYLKMVGACLARAELDRELSFVATWVTNFDLDGFDVTIDETEGLIDLVRRTSEAEVACVCKETVDGIRVSLRSVSDLDVGSVAARFGGGGHKYAAGFVAPYPVTGVLDGIKQALREQREAQSQHRS